MNIKSFSGTITMIHDMVTAQGNQDDNCYKVMAVENSEGGLVQFIVSPNTYVFDLVKLAIGDMVTGYYDGDAPAPLIFPPQYQALIMVKDDPDKQVKVAYFTNDLVSADGQLQLNISPNTAITLRNGQPFMGNLTERNLIVIYGPATKSIPAQTTPYQIIVLCSE